MQRKSHRGEMKSIYNSIYSTYNSKSIKDSGNFILHYCFYSISVRRFLIFTKI